jgi:hypothetical protein
MLHGVLLHSERTAVNGAFKDKKLSGGKNVNGARVEEELKKCLNF